MAEKRKQNPRYTTPRVKFIWPTLYEPDYKYKDCGEFRVKALFDSTDLAEFVKKLKPIHERADAEGREAFKNLPVPARKKLEAKGGYSLKELYTPVYDDAEEETGEGTIIIKMNHKITRKKDGKEFRLYPDVFDSRGRPIRKKIDVGSGTVGRITFEAFPYFTASSGEAGVSFRLIAVQLLDVVQFGQRSATEYGFAAEEDGYDSSAYESDEEEDSDNSGASDDNSAEEEDDF